MNIAKPCIVIVAGIMFAACSNNPTEPFEHKLDEQSGESFTQVREPLRLIAPRPALSRVGKDYLFVAPVLVSGTRAPQDYLWFSIGSSIDREITGAAPPEINAVVLVLDDKPMTFDLLPWTEIAASSPFKPGVAHYASFGSKITKSQLRHLAAARSISAFITNNADRSPKYQLVDGSYAEWARF
jgi:hypothetical protein